MVQAKHPAVWLVVADAAVWVAGPAWAGVLVTGGLAGLYWGSLRWPWVPCPKCRSHQERPTPFPLSVLFGGYRKGCRSKWCVSGDRLRLGVRVLQPGRARALLADPREVRPRVSV